MAELEATPGEVVPPAETPSAPTIGQHWRHLALAAPDAPAITCGSRSVTRMELEQRTNRLARAYLAAGVTPDSFVTICLSNSVEFLEAAIAVWKCGATPQPLSDRLPLREREAIIGLARPTLVVGVRPSARHAYRSVAADFEPDPLLDDSPLPPIAATSWKAPASGGSTGLPKLIVSTQPALRDTVVPFAELLGMEHNRPVLVTGPLFHNAPFLVSACALALGGHAVVMSRFDAEEALQLVERYRIDWMYAVPTMMSRIWRLPAGRRDGYDVTSLRVLMHMAAPCPPWLKKSWIDWLGADRIWELYGATEVQSVTIMTGREWLEHPGTVGRPVIGEMQIRDPEGQPVPPGTIGEIWMRRGEGMANPYRYIGAEAKTMGQGWESVGDMGRMDDEGYLYLSDRMSDMMLVGGSNVYPAEIESALTEHRAVRSAVVIGLPHADLGQVPHALLELDTPVSDDDLRGHLGDRLAPYKIPRTFERVTTALRDDAGKVRRTALQAARAGG
jgi:bile acid-coenzyme A ligase